MTEPKPRCPMCDHLLPAPRDVERRCESPTCREIFVVTTPANRKRYCGRDCQLANYKRPTKGDKQL